MVYLGLLFAGKQSIIAVIRGGGNMRLLVTFHPLSRYREMNLSLCVFSFCFLFIKSRTPARGKELPVFTSQLKSVQKHSYR